MTQANQNSDLRTLWYDLGDELRKLTRRTEDLYRQWVDQTRRLEKQEHLKDLEDCAEEAKRAEEERLRDSDRELEAVRQGEEECSKQADRQDQV